MLHKYVREYEAVRNFTIGEYKKKMRIERERFDDDEFKMIENDFTHDYYQTIKALGEERDAKLTTLKEEFEAKT